MTGWADRNGELVDLHTHVIPGIDDGAQDEDEARTMLQTAADDGIRVVAATPHAAACSQAQILAGVAQLNELAAAEGLPVTVVSGSEVRLEADVAARFRAGQLATINQTPYLLLELSTVSDWPPFLGQVIYELQLAGAWPILAHAERYPAVQRRPGLLQDLVRTGVLVQVNATSLTGIGGRSQRHAAEHLLRSRLAHLIASDAHDPVTRPPKLRTAMDYAASLTDPTYATWLVEASRAVVEGRAVTPPEPQLEAGEGRLARWWRRFRAG